MAVLEKKVGLHLASSDAYVNIAGGMKMTEPAIDLGICLAIASSMKEMCIRDRIMKVLIVGSGGREHAIAWSVSRSPKADKIYCAPGNAGIAEYAECVNIGAMEFEKLADFAQENQIDLTIIGICLLYTS